MEKFIKYCLVLVIASCVVAQHNDEKDYSQDLYDYQWYDDEIEKLSLNVHNEKEKKDIEPRIANDDNVPVNEIGQNEKQAEENILIDSDEIVQENQFDDNQVKFDIPFSQEISKSGEEHQAQPDTEDLENLFNKESKLFDNDNDYVLEDNRLYSQEDSIIIKSGEENKDEGEVVKSKFNDFVIEDNLPVIKDDMQNMLNELLDVFENDENVPSNEKNEEEAIQILDINNDAKILIEEQRYQSQVEESIPNDVQEVELLTIGDNNKSEIDLEEDKSLQNMQLDKTDDDMVNDNGNINENKAIIVEETRQLLDTIDSGFNDSGNDNADKIYEDLHSDLDELFNTFDKLSQSNNDDNNNDKPEAVSNQIEDYEEKFGRPFRESQILQMRQDYLDDLDKPTAWNDNENVDIVHEIENNISNDKLLDVNIADILDKLDKELEQDADDTFQVPEKPTVQLYGDDPLFANEKVNEKSDKSVKNVELVISSDEQNNFKTINDLLSEDNEDTHSNQEEFLTSAEIKSKMEEFMNSHKEELDVNANGFDRNVAPIHVTLKLNQTFEVNSPGYPGFYPTNNIIDWIFQGDGLGIEMNITDLSLNGHLEDYLLVKPGGIDESGQDGLVFTHHLNSERRYRFLDVDRMFVRFRAHPGPLFARGFNFTVKLVGPIPVAPEPVPIPIPEPDAPEQTVTIYLGGLLTSELRNRSEEFRSIIADMATFYINRHGVYPGDSNTINVTYITSIAECHIGWPGHEPCAAVTFGVPLDYSDERDYRLTSDELEYMWFMYSYVDPFAVRLERMGISEFAVPNQVSVMTAWMVIGSGVLFFVIMLAFAFLRWNCFRDYTRMPLYADNDSIISDKKRDNLDLYPTPHQNLPPLYNDGHFEENWTNNFNSNYQDNSRVDLGGFTNTSYSRDSELLDLDSDEDVIVSLPGQNNNRSDGLNITSKHIFEV